MTPVELGAEFKSISDHSRPCVVHAVMRDLEHSPTIIELFMAGHMYGVHPSCEALYLKDMLSAFSATSRSGDTRFVEEWAQAQHDWLDTLHRFKHRKKIQAHEVKGFMQDLMTLAGGPYPFYASFRHQDLLGRVLAHVLYISQKVVFAIRGNSRA